jgi:hypothetical protein
LKGENEMKERLNKLLSIKSIVTILLTLLFFILSVKGTIGSQEVMTIFTVVISFYFGTQAKKE